MDNRENVIERMSVTEKTTITVERSPEGKIRVTSLLWPEPKVILNGEVLEVRNMDAACTSPEKQQFASAFVTNIRRNGQNPT